MAARPTSSVVVVTYNHRHAVDACLRAVLDTVPPRTEVIVVDNASTDGTAEHVGARFPGVRLVRSARNLGFGGANNLAAAQAGGEYLVFVNPDAIPQPGWLDALAGAVATDPDATLATAKLVLARAPDRIDTVGNDVHISGITPSRGWGEPAGGYTQTEEVSAVSGACFALSRRLFERLGGFDERLFLYYEDTELSLRARLAGCRCLAVPDAVVLHDHRPGFSPDKLRYLERNRWWTLLKTLRVRTLVALTPVLLLAEGLVWTMAACSGPAHVRAKLASWIELLAWLPSLPRERGRLQRLRRVPDTSLIRRHSARLRASQVVRHPLVQLAEWLLAVWFRGGRALAAAAGG